MVFWVEMYVEGIEDCNLECFTLALLTLKNIRNIREYVPEDVWFVRGICPSFRRDMGERSCYAHIVHVLYCLCA